MYRSILRETTARVWLFGFSLVSGKNRKLLQAHKHGDRSVDGAALSLVSTVDNIYALKEERTAFLYS